MLASTLIPVGAGGTGGIFEVVLEFEVELLLFPMYSVDITKSSIYL
jgi:hypothetical protein